MIRIERYTADHSEEWNAFVRESKNGSFLLLRGYMDYHSDRFADYSLMAYSKDRLVAVLPANREGDTVYSHKGLTYGGWIMPKLHFNVVDMLELMSTSLEMMRTDGVKHLIYKPMPYIYHNYPAEEDLYALFRYDARIVAANVSTVIDLANPLHFNTGAKSSLSVAHRNNVVISESSDFEGYWQVLSDLLRTRYGAKPVHTIDEILRLHGAFPDNIRLFTATSRGELLGGVVMYFTGQVAHSQYTSATPQGWAMRVLPAVYDYIIKNECAAMRYFDFGTSNEDDGRYLNEGLVLQKCGMGGRAVVYNTYKIEL